MSLIAHLFGFRYVQSAKLARQRLELLERVRGQAHNATPGVSWVMEIRRRLSEAQRKLGLAVLRGYQVEADPRASAAARREVEEAQRTVDEWQTQLNQYRVAEEIANLLRLEVQGLEPAESE